MNEGTEYKGNEHFKSPIMGWCLILPQPSEVSVIIITLQTKKTNVTKLPIVKQLINQGLEIQGQVSQTSESMLSPVNS